MKEKIWSIKWDNFVIEFLDEIKTEFENTLACLLGTQMVSNHTSWQAQTTDLNHVEYILYILFTVLESPHM